MFRVLDLFSGIGGFSLGLERTGGFKTVAFCEIEPFCRRVLAKHWPGVPIYDDVRTSDFERGEAAVITAGFPCPDISWMGPAAGLSGERSGLVWQALRAVRVVGPRLLLLENVAAMLHRGMGQILGALASEGYDTEWDCISAADFGAPHLRERVWIVAYPDSFDRGAGEVEIFAAVQNGIETLDSAGWPTEPSVCRVDDGLPRSLDATRALGNAVVPQIPELIGRAIMASQNARVP